MPYKTKHDKIFNIKIKFINILNGINRFKLCKARDMCIKKRDDEWSIL